MTYKLLSHLLASVLSAAALPVLAQTTSPSSCTGTPVQINFGNAYPEANYWPQTQFNFPAGSSSNASPDVNFSMQWDAAPSALPLTHTAMIGASLTAPDGSSSPSPWFVTAQTVTQSPGTVGTLHYIFSKPVGNLGFGIGSIDSGAALESVAITATMANGSVVPITLASPYATPPSPPSAWPASPTVYYVNAGDSISGGVFTGNDQIYIAVPAATPVTAINVTYSIDANSSGGIGFTPPTFERCTPAQPAASAPTSVPSSSQWSLVLLGMLLAGTALWRHKSARKLPQ